MALIYHYTTPAGFAGILDSRGIWVTDTRFLNDPQEFKTGWDVFDAVLKSHEAELFTRYPEALERIVGARRGVEITTAHVASFSYGGDVLSQWRGYNGGYGFAIGFDEDAVFSAAQAQGFDMGPVAYERREHVEAMHTAFTHLMRELAEGVRPASVVFLQWWIHMQKVAIVLKNEHFREEAEVRLYTSRGSDPEGVLVRATGRALIPYLQMQLDQHDPLRERHVNLGIKRVIVGPAMSANQKMAAEFLLKQHHIDVPVEDSAIPYIGT